MGILEPIPVSQPKAGKHPGWMAGPLEQPEETHGNTGRTSKLQTERPPGSVGTRTWELSFKNKTSLINTFFLCPVVSPLSLHLSQAQE